MNEKGEGLIEQSTEKPTKIEVTYTGPDGKQETIVLDFEKELIDFIDFYKKTEIDLPENFEEVMRDIWNRNQEQIQREIESKGFDDVLLVPGNILLQELKNKMSTEDGYWKSPDFNALSDSFSDIINSKTGQNNRIVLTFKAKELTDRPELMQTININGYDGYDAVTLSLEDYLIFSKKYFESTEQHLDETKGIWTSNSTDTSLSINVNWDRISHSLLLTACSPSIHNFSIGARPSRSFI